MLCKAPVTRGKSSPLLVFRGRPDLPNSKNLPGVIVQGSGLNALGVVRSLAVEKVGITLIDAHPGGPAINSRYVRSHFCQRGAVDEGAALLQALVEVARASSQPPVLILTQEAAVAAVSRHRAQLTGLVRQVLPEAGLLGELMDKASFQRRAEALGFPVPRSVILDGSVNLSAVAALAYPCVLKPVVKSEHWEHTFKKAYRFDDFAALDAFWKSVENKPPVIVQEWIEGGDSDVYFTLVHRDAQGRTCASFTGRKIRQWPPLVGGTASCMPAPEAAAELDDLTKRFFDAVGLVGLASMEYKRDRRSGRFVMVEPTIGRTDYQEEIATLNGVNVVQAAYRSMAGLPAVGTHPPARPVIWCDSTGDARSREAQPDASVPTQVAGLRVVDALYRTGDPVPWLKSQMQRVAGRIARIKR